GPGRCEAVRRVVDEELVEAGRAVALGEGSKRLDRGERRLGDPVVCMEERADDRARIASDLLAVAVEELVLARRALEPLLGGEPVAAHRVPAIGALRRELDVPRRPGRDRERRPRTLDREPAPLVPSEQVVELLDEASQPLA